MRTYSFLTQIFFSLSFIISFARALNNGISVELIHRDSLKSPFHQPTQNKYQHVVNALRRSINRVNHFYKDSLTNTPKSTVISDSSEYLMSYSVGTPPFHVLGIVDTGSDIVWLQCEPCEECYNQTTPIFNPSKSSSYKNIPCTSRLCNSCSKQNSCEYTIKYGDQSHSKGDLSLETLTLDSNTGNLVSFPNTTIGCGHSNTGMFPGASSGIVGLGNGALSLMKQLETTIGEKFSYCLVPYTPKSNTSSILNFGDAAVVSGDGVVSTPIVIKNPPTFYFLTLEAFSVGNQRIEFRGSSSGGDEGNIIIDSGTTLTLLPSDIYTNLESAVAELVKLKRVDDPGQFLNLCYSLTSDEYDFPIITAHFQGADVKLESISSFVSVADDIVCLAFQSSKIGTIFGNLAQQNLLVGYDLQKKTVSFKPTDCTKLNSM
ncbi:aspartic proteinase CDR1-like [Vicia villosa]|uniref:aspartic proteinase CDR1-like n=1 Tax=Vicia villosa TaxID=3911 RepID=UPI00273AA00D|nr:aspartic proteinase CDR1-like [Vicia villosa]